MSLSDAYIDVTCDGCHSIEQIQLTAMARGGWDERDLKYKLEDISWIIVGDLHYCEECRKGVGNDA
jgi:hypothetical protein